MSRLRHGVVFLAVYAKEFVVANAQVVREVVTPGSGVRPAVLRVPLRSRTDVEVATFVALVGLTPGTAVLEVDGSPGGAREDGAGGVELVVHAMDAPDLDAQRRDLQRLEGLLLAALRGAP